MGPEGHKGGVELPEGDEAKDGPPNGPPIPLEDLGDPTEEGQACMGDGHVGCHSDVRVAKQWGHYSDVAATAAAATIRIAGGGGGICVLLLV